MNYHRLIQRFFGWSIAATVLSAALCFCGCTVGESSQEVGIRHQRVIDNNLGRIQDDVDAVFLLDRPTRLSDKFVR